MKGDRRGMHRRGLLLKLGGTAAVALGMGAEVVPTSAFSSMTGERDSTVNVADGLDALIGILDQGPVKRNSREPMVEIANNTTSEVTVTITLDDCNAGELHDNEGGSGCAVTFSILDGNSQIIDITAAEKGTIPYSINASGGGITFETTYQVEATSGADASAVSIEKPSKDRDFEARRNQTEWRIKQVDIRDKDADGDLDYATFEITEGGSGGTTVATRTVQMSDYKYTAKNFTITPDDSSYSIPAGQDYTLRIRAYDIDGNFATETLFTTA